MERKNIFYVLISFFTLILLALTRKYIVSGNFINYIIYFVMLIFYFGLIKCVNSLIIDALKSENKFERWVGILFIPLIFFLLIGAFTIFIKEALESGNLDVYILFYSVVSFGYILNMSAKYLSLIKDELQIYYKLFIAYIIICNMSLAIGIYDYTVYATPEILRRSEILFNESIMKGFTDCMGNGLKIAMGGLKNLEYHFVLAWFAGGALIKNKLFDVKY